MKTNIDLSDYTVSVVDSGEVSISIETFGKVVPFSEVILTSPITAKLEEVFIKPGDSVDTDDKILKISDESLKLKFDKLSDEYKLIENAIKSLKLDITEKESKLLSLLEINSLNIEKLKSKLSNEKHLLKIGGGSKMRISQAENDLEVALISQNQLKESFKLRKERNRLNLEEFLLNLSIKDKVIKETEKSISDCIIKSPVKGVSLSLSCRVGQSILKGQSLGNIADISEYKIKASISDRYTRDIFSGQKVYINIDTFRITGKISNISPSIEGGSILFTVNISGNTQNILRSNMQVKVRIVKSGEKNCLRIRNNNFYDKPGYKELFVIAGDYIEKRKIEFGGCSYDYIEVVSGLKIGEKVILSNDLVNRYRNKTGLFINEN